MTVIVREDLAEAGGYAFLDLDRKISRDAIRVAFRRLDIDPRYLGVDGWQAEIVWLNPDGIDNNGVKTVLRIGPAVVDSIPEFVPVEISIEGVGVISTVNWPSLAKSGRGLSDVRIVRPRGPANPVNISTAKPPQPPEPPPPPPLPPTPPPPPLPPVRPEVTKPQVAAVASDEKKKKGAGRWIALAACLLIALVSAALLLPKYLSGSTGSLASSDAPIIFTQSANGEFTQSEALDITARSKSVAWRIDNSSKPDWLLAAPIEGNLAKDETRTINLSVRLSRANLPSPGDYPGKVTFLYGPENRQLQRKVQLTIPAPVRSNDGELTSDRRDIIVFTGPVGGPFTPSPTSFKLTARGNSGSYVSWSIDNTYPGWLSVTPTSGRLDPGESANISLSVGRPANSSGPGEYPGEVTVTYGATAKKLVQKVKLVVQAPPKVSELIGYPTPIVFTALRGGNTSPGSATTNLGASGNIVSWRTLSKPSWIQITPDSGTIATNTNLDVTLRVGAGETSRPVGTYEGSIVFNNASGQGRVEQSVKLVVLDPGAECDRLMATQFDNDLSPQIPPADADSLSDADVDQAIAACTLAMRGSAPRRFASEAGRAYAQRAARRARTIDSQPAAREDMDQALQAWRTAAANNSGAAMNFLGAYYKGTFNANYLFTVPDYQQALNYWLNGANVGNARSMRNAGAVLLRGSEQYAPVQKDVVKAKEFLTRADQRGEMGATNALGQSYFYGDGVEKNTSLGLDLITKACRAGDQDAKKFFDLEYSRSRRRDGLPPERPC